MILRPGVGFLADLNILFPFQVDIFVVGSSVLAMIFWGKKILGVGEKGKP
jgi:hypothetical protein